MVMATTGDVKGGPPVYGNGFLPAAYQPTVLRNTGSPVLYLDPPAGAPDLAPLVREGRLDPADVAEVGEIVAGTRPGRTSPEQITLYRSVGVAVQDVAAAALVLDAAHEHGGGTEVEM